MVSRTHPKHPSVWTCALCVIWLSVVGGCRLPWFPLFSFMTPRQEAHQLRTIDGIALDKESKSSPKHLGDAATKDSKAGAATNTEELPPPPTSDPSKIGSTEMLRLKNHSSRRPTELC